MRRKLTITVDERVYTGLHQVIGRRRISGFIESLVKPHVVQGGEQRKAMADQLTTLGKARLQQRIGVLFADGLVGVERAIKVQLGMGR